MAYQLLDYIADQLKALAPSADWNIGQIDRARELAVMLVRAGVTDMTKLRVEPVTIHTPERYETHEGGDVWVPASDQRSFRIRNVVGTFGFVGTPNRADQREALEVYGDGTYRVAWSAAGHGAVAYVLAPRAQGGFAFVPMWESTSDTGFWKDTFNDILPFVMGAITLASIGGISAAGFLGKAIVGAELAASYPALASAVGNVALSTAFNGGDFGAAVKGAAIGAVGGSAGGAVSTNVSALANSPILGEVAGAATRAFITGGDVKQSIAGAVLARGGTMWFGDDSPELPYDVLPPVNGDDSSYSFDDPFIGYNPDSDIPNYGDSWGSENQVGGDGGSDADYPPTFPAPLPIDEWNVPPVTLPPPLPPMPIPDIDYGASSTWNPTNVVQGISTAAAAALSLVNAFARLRNPALQTTARNVNANGTVSVVGNNGLIQTRTASGAISSVKPPVGVPQATLDGNYVVNNGNGTYTVVTPSGQSGTYRYPATAGTNTLSSSGSIISGIPDTALLIGGAAVALMLLSKK